METNRSRGGIPTGDPQRLGCAAITRVSPLHDREQPNTILRWKLTRQMGPKPAVGQVFLTWSYRVFVSAKP